MKRILSLVLGLTLLSASAAYAQYYEIANQLTGLISPVLSGAFNYKGFVELGGTAGLGHDRANFIGISTSQGFKYSSWFFMGAGIGVDVAMANQTNLTYSGDYDYPDYLGHSTTKTKVMIPVFSDFRFTIGDQTATSFFIDLKIGAAWLMGSDYLRMDRGCLTDGTQFYFKPSAGVRIPIGNDNRRAVNIGLTYQLLTSNNNYYRHSNSLTLSNIGATIGFEW